MSSILFLIIIISAISVTHVVLGQADIKTEVDVNNAAAKVSEQERIKQWKQHVLEFLEKQKQKDQTGEEKTVEQQNFEKLKNQREEEEIKWLKNQMEFEKKHKAEWEELENKIKKYKDETLKNNLKEMQTKQTDIKDIKNIGVNTKLLQDITQKQQEKQQEQYQQNPIETIEKQNQNKVQQIEKEIKEKMEKIQENLEQIKQKGIEAQKNKEIRQTFVDSMKAKYNIDNMCDPELCRLTCVAGGRYSGYCERRVVCRCV